MSDISIVRGDTLMLSIGSIKTADGEEYILSDTDVVYLDVKKSAADKAAVFRKDYQTYINDILDFSNIREVST